MAEEAVPGGFDMNALMKQAQQMQTEMLQAQEQLKDEVVEASAGGGMVKVKMGGDLTLREISIDPEAIDPEEAEMLAEMVQAAVNEAIRAAQELASSKMGGITGGPGGMAAGLPGACERRGPRAAGAPRRRAVAAARDRPAHRAAARLPHPARPRRGGRRRSPTAIREVKEKVGLCEECFNLSEGPLCRICADPSRDRATICVVEEPADVIPIERTHEYRGLYHVLGGALSPIDGIDAEDLKIAELLRRVEAGGVAEVVLATNPTTTGEATALHIAERLRGQVDRHPPRQRPAGRRRPRARRRGHPRQGAGRPPQPRLARQEISTGRWSTANSGIRGSLAVRPFRQGLRRVDGSDAMPRLARARRRRGSPARSPPCRPRCWSACARSWPAPTPSCSPTPPSASPRRSAR